MADPKAKGPMNGVKEPVAVVRGNIRAAGRRHGHGNHAGAMVMRGPPRTSDRGVIEIGPASVRLLRAEKSHRLAGIGISLKSPPGKIVDTELVRHLLQRGGNLGRRWL